MIFKSFILLNLLIKPLKIILLIFTFYIYIKVLYKVKLNLLKSLNY